MAAVPVLRRNPPTTAWLVATLAFGASAFGGPGMQFVPIRSAPWISVCDGDGTTLCTLDADCAGPGGPCNHLRPAVGTIGSSVTPIFNVDLGCWELELPAGAGGFDVDIDLQAFGWGMATGSPTLGAIQGTVNAAGFSNGNGADLNPRGWPENPGNSAYQPKTWCDPALGGDGGPCNTGPFGPCEVVPDSCIHNPDWVMPTCTGDFPAIATHILDYAWATAAITDCNVDDGEVKTLGGLILEVPVNAAGTYLIDFDRMASNSFMTAGSGQPINAVVFTPACITLVCQEDADCTRNDNLDCTTDSCDEVTSTCKNIVTQDTCLIDDMCYANGQVDPAEECRFCFSNMSQTDWSNRIAGFACGTAPDTECDHPDTCDGFGACLENFEATGSACNEETETDCDLADTCDGAGICSPNIVPNGTACTDDGNDCTSDICNQSRCRHIFSDAGTRCGDTTDIPCDAADTCDGSGNCLSNVLPNEAPCPNDNFCDGAEVCLGGVCQSADPPCDLETDLCDEQDDECDLLGDFDGDMLVTQTDFSHWPDCETGPIGEPYAPGCEFLDFEQNGVVDLRDNAGFQNAFTGP